MSTPWIAALEDQIITETFKREHTRLRNFIWKRVPDRADAEDILQEVFFELVEAYRLAKPIEQVGAWLFRVARNRITDLFRKTKTDALADSAGGNEEDKQEMPWVDLLSAPEAGPELDPFRWIPGWPVLWSSWTAQYEGALGTNDSRTARQIS